MKQKFAGRLPADLAISLSLNEVDDKKQVAIKKILKHHQYFDMQPFFKWDLKVLPLVIDWFERAKSIEVAGGDDDHEEVVVEDIS